MCNMCVRAYIAAAAVGAVAATGGSQSKCIAGKLSKKPINNHVHPPLPHTHTLTHMLLYTQTRRRVCVCLYAMHSFGGYAHASAWSLGRDDDEDEWPGWGGGGGLNCIELHARECVWCVRAVDRVSMMSSLCVRVRLCVCVESARTQIFMTVTAREFARVSACAASI